MKIYRETDFTKGWFVGLFEPTLLKTDQFEVSVKRYEEGDKESRHFHKIAKEFTVIGTGLFRMNEKVLDPGSIVVIEPGESTDFECLKSGVNFVIKTPSVAHDKYSTNTK